jgi:phospholipase C
MKACAHRSLSCISSPLALVFLFPLLLVFSGCGGSSFNGSSSPVMPTVNIAASPASISAGSSSMLSVAASNALGVTVAGSDGSSYSLPASGGTQAVSPTATTTYTATATGTGGKASSAISVTVVEAASAPTVTIAANPSSITAGSSSTLTVTATNATAVTVSGSDGSSYKLAASGGKQAVSPSATTTYTANATGAGGKASAVASVTVTAAAPPGMPTVAISANPTSITAGSTSTLTVTATNATAVTVTGSDGSSYNLSASGGNQVVSPTATTTYTAKANGAGGAASATAVVTVTTSSMPAVTLVANPTSITAGGSSTLTVTATNATQVAVSGSDGSSYTLSASGGVQAVSPTATTTYTANATGTGGKASAVTTVTVTAAAPPPPAPTVTIAASPTSISAGGTSTLMVAASNATTVTIAGSDGSSYNLSASGGTQAVTPAGSTTYTATASGAGGTVSAVATVTVVAVAPPPAPTVTIAAAPTTVISGNESTLTVVATNSATVVVTGTDGSSYNLSATGGVQEVTPTATTTYTAAASGTGGNASASATVTVTAAGSIQSINHVVFMLQENHTFDNYFGMLNPYREAKGWNIGDDGNNYEVDGIDDKLKTSNENDSGVSFPLFKLRSTCIDDDSSEWLSSFGDVNRYNFKTSRPIQENGFVHTGEGFATNCANTGRCTGTYTDVAGQRAMGYYDEDFLNYYYYMAAQFAVSDRWFSPIASKSTPNRIAMFSGGTTQGLIRDPGYDDHLAALPLPSIFEALDNAGVSWKLYYTQTVGGCLDGDDCAPGTANEPGTTFGYIDYYHKYEYVNPTHAACKPPTQPSSVVGDPKNSFCIDPTHIAKLSTYFSDVANGNLPSFSFIESGSGTDEHPASWQNVLGGQVQVASIINAFMVSPSWNDSVFFFSYDEGGGPYDHVPPVPGHSNDFTDKSLLSATTIPDIGSIVVNPDSYFPCLPSTPPATQHCDLQSGYPGTSPGDAASVHGFAAQIGFRLPNIVISPFTRRHYVSHIPMDHTAVIKFVENRFIGPNAHLTARDAVQPDLLDFFDFNNVPWAKPPTPPNPVTSQTLGYSPCTPAALGP